MSKNEALRRGLKKWEWKEDRSRSDVASSETFTLRLSGSIFQLMTLTSVFLLRGKWGWHWRGYRNGSRMKHSRGQTAKAMPPDWVRLRVDTNERAGNTSVALHCYIPAPWKHLDWITLQGDQNTNQTTSRIPVDWKWQCWFWLSPVLSEALRERIWESKNWSWSRAANLTRSWVPEAIKQIKKNNTIIILMSYCAYLYW